MKTRKHPSSWLKELRSNFECGGCNIYFDSAYLLHDHMRDHVEGGSYYYNNTIQTAFPVSTTTEVATQTCPSDLDDIKVDKFVEFVANVKHEEGSDMDIYDDFDDWNEENDDENEAGKSKFTNNKTEKLKPNDRDRVPLSVTTGPMPGSKGKVVSNVVQTSKQKRKSSRPLKHSQANTNHYSEIAESFSKQSSLHIQDILVSLTRIDDVMKTKTTHESTVLNKNLVKRLHENDDGLTIRKYRKQRLLKRKKKLLRGKKNIMRKVNKGSDESGLSDDESDKSDPDYKPEWDPPESPVAFKDDNSEICEEDNDHNGDPHCKKARLECKNMKCEHCDKFIESAFSKANLLALHEIPFRQQNCCIYIKSRKALHKEHNGKVCHEENEMEFVIDKEAVKETFICDECGVICKDKNNFRRHKKIHKHSLTCPHCDFTPTSRKYFRIHMKTHKQKTDLRCDFCGSLFNHNKNLLRHVRAVHMGQKRFMCDICGKLCYAQQEVREHRLIHFAPTYQCSYCDRKFRGLSAKQRHERIHTGEKRYVCHVCNHGFIQSTPNWVHMEKQHEIPKVEAMAMRKEQVYVKKVIVANFEHEIKGEIRSQEAADTASKI